MMDPNITNSKSLFSLLIQANELRYQKNYRSALTHYITAIEQYGERIELLEAIAHCYFAAILLQQSADLAASDAIVWIKKAIALEPDNSYLYVDLAQFYALVMTDYQQAAQAYSKALELDSSNIQALIGASALYGVPEEVVTRDAAIQWLERAIQLRGSDADNYHSRLGDLYYQAGRLSDAKEQWLKALLRPQPIDPKYTQTIMTKLGS